MTRPPTKYIAIHEAGHAVVTVMLGGYAERITLIQQPERLGGCATSWPADGICRKEERLVALAAGAAATAIYRRCSMELAIFQTGLGDVQAMERIGDSGGRWFREARRRCRAWWPMIVAVADAARVTGELTEQEISDAMDSAL